MGKILSLLLSFSISSAQAFELPVKLQKMVGQTFSKPGPNCFAAALYGSDVYDSFRGVSENEFAEVLKSACVKIEKPKFGDVGVYTAKSFGFVHAFVYLDKDSAFEKPGVDYVGKTPVRIQHQESIDYIHMASQECRRYGDESCHNQKSFYRCGAVAFGARFEKTLKVVNSLLDQILRNDQVSFENQNELMDVYTALEVLAQSDLEKAVFESVQKQVDFLRLNPQKMMNF